jgi:mRNA interferase RelE/StbE
MAYQVVFKPHARRQLEKLPKSLGERLAVAMDGLGAQPRPVGCVKLAGNDGLWRIRVGDYRIVCQIFDDRLVVLVVRLGHRRDIYD